MSAHAIIRGQVELTGMPLEQLMPAPETTTTFFALAILVETSDSCRLAEKSFGQVDVSSCSRGRLVIGMVAVRVWSARSRDVLPGCGLVWWLVPKRSRWFGMDCLMNDKGSR